MKLSASDVRRFLSSPGEDVRAVLVYGQDRGLVSERASALAAAVNEAAADPFSSVDLAAKTVAADPARLADEVRALSLMPGRRVVRLRDATDGLTEAIKRAVAQDAFAAFLIVDAGELAKGSSLRRYFESAKDAAAIGCYPDDASTLASVVRDTVATAGKGIEPDAEALLVGRLGADRAMTRMELEKLVLYCGDAPTIRVEDVRAVLGGSQTDTLGTTVTAVFNGDLAAAENALEGLFASGTQPVSILRAAASHAMRLHLTKACMEAGQSAKDAMNKLRPPVFFRDAPAFQRQLRTWTESHLATALHLLIEAEIDCKSTGAPAAAICARALLRIAQAAGRQSR